MMAERLIKELEKENPKADHVLEFCRDHGLMAEKEQTRAEETDLAFSWDTFTSDDFLNIKEDIRNKETDYAAFIRIGTICIDCATKEYDDGIRLDYDFYVGGEDTGYGYKKDYPYDYADGGSFCKEILDMTYPEFKAYAEKTLRDYIVKNDRQSTYSLMEHAKQALLIW